MFKPEIIELQTKQRKQHTEGECHHTSDSRDNEVVVADTGPGSSTPLVTATLPGRAPAVLDTREQVTRVQ